MTFAESMDKPFFIGTLAVVWIEAVEVLAALSAGSKVVLQLAIGVLTIIYLVHKIRNIKKQNDLYDQKENDRADL